VYNDPDGHTAGQESIFDAGLISSPLGNDPGGSGRYDNSLVYLLCLFCVLFAPIFGPIALAVSGYRVAKRRPHAVRGLAVAGLTTLAGGLLLVWAVTA